MARERTGNLVWRKKGWCARVTVDVDGETVTRWHPLDTTDRAAAKRKLKRLVAKLEAERMSTEQAAVVASGAETVDEYATDWLAKRVGFGLPSATYEQRIYLQVWKKAIGHLTIASVRPSHLKAVLEDVATGRIQWTRLRRIDAKTTEIVRGRYSRQSVVHMRATVFRMFKSARADELIPSNPVDVVEIPPMRQTKKERTILNDVEIAKLLAHTDVDLEIKMLVLLSRTVGGMRAGDLNAWDWTAVDLVHFDKCVVPRSKTRAPQEMAIPITVGPFLRAWWTAHDSPTSGPVFPVRRGPRAGEGKKKGNMSYADRLRRELLKAGIDRHELHHETAATKPVDFHSTRRAYKTALARAGVNVQTALMLAGDSDTKSHMRYVNSLVGRDLPDAAVPSLPPVQSAQPDQIRKQKPRILRAGHGIRTRDPELGKQTRDAESSLEQGVSGSGSLCWGVEGSAVIRQPSTFVDQNGRVDLLRVVHELAGVASPMPSGSIAELLRMSTSTGDPVVH